LTRGCTISGEIQLARLGNVVLDVESVQVSLQSRTDSRLDSATEALRSNGFRYRFDHLGEGEYFVNAVVAEVEQYSVDNGRKVDLAHAAPCPEVNVEVSQIRELTGIAQYSSGEPAVGAWVAPFRKPYPIVQNVRVGEDGRFSLPGLNPGNEYGLRFEGGRLGRRRPIVPAEEWSGAIYNLGKEEVGRLIAVFFVEGEEIIENLSFVCVLYGKTAVRGVLKTTDSGRALAIDSYEKGLFWDSKDRIYAPTVVDFRTMRDGDEINVELRPSETLTGKVLGPGGSPIYVAHVIARLREAPRWEVTTKTDTVGDFRLDGLPLDPSTITISVSEAAGLSLPTPLTPVSYDQATLLRLVESPSTKK
jgi:hypothetical protein